MTKDNVSLQLSSVIYYRITSPHKAAFGISNIRQALVERTQTTLRHVIGARVLQDVIERREEIAQGIREIIEETTLNWGVEVESMLIKDIIFSEELQESLSMAAQSKRTGEAKVIAARAEVESAKLMRQAADILSSAPAMQIRYLEAMQAMAKSGQSKIIFMPGPTNSGDFGLSGVQGQLAGAVEGNGEGGSGGRHGQGQGNSGFQSAINSAMVEHM
jgi:erythrocyte band 7 integral membrane protein